MSVYDVNSTGIAPSGLSTGDLVNTAGGLFQIVRPGTPGSKYNSSSGYSSLRVDGSFDDALMAYNQALSDYNTARSQDFAREQMGFQSQSNAKAMEFSARQAELNRQWQERMSSTAHQREVKDLIAAGLNPVLSAKYGGSSTPAGGTASGLTSSGASGNVDSSASQMIGGLLTALISQSTALETTAMNNENAVKTMSMANLAALQQTQMSAGAMIDSALTSAAAARYASDQSYKASTYASDQSFKGTKYSNDMSYLRDKYKAFMNIFEKQFYPSNMVTAVSGQANNLMNSMLGNKSAIQKLWNTFFNMTNKIE